MTSLTEIRAEIDRASERRAELWHTLSEGHDPELVAELKRLDERIERLWDEHRSTRARLRFGEREDILHRARAEERIDRAA
jgi:hypothetical protein